MTLIERKSGEIVYLTAPNIPVAHAFTTRLGGVSDGIFASLNLSFDRGDSHDRVVRNFGLICGELGIDAGDIVCLNQVHGKSVYAAASSDRNSIFSGAAAEADALITSDNKIALMVRTADCVPILLYDPESGTVGAVHAGWRGTAAGIAGEAVAKMAREMNASPGDIRAAIGPCISKCCFETDSDVADAFIQAGLDKLSEGIITRRGNKYLVDLKEANRQLLMRAGVRDGNIAVGRECTCCEHEKFWSHRYTDGRRGSQAAIIALKGNAPR